MTLTLFKMFPNSPNIVRALVGAVLSYWPSQSTNKQIIRSLGKFGVSRKQKSLVELHIASNKVAFSYILILVLCPYPLISRSSSPAIVLSGYAPYSMPDAAYNQCLTKVHLSDKTSQLYSFGNLSYVYVIIVASSCIRELKLRK